MRSVIIGLIIFMAAPAMAQETTDNPDTAVVESTDSSEAADAEVPAEEAPTKTTEAPTTVETVEDAVSAVSETVQAFKGGKYLLGVGFIIMILVWAIRAFAWKAIPKKAMPWVAVVLGAVLAMGTAWAEGVPWYNGLFSGIAAGLSGIGTYEVLGKKGLKKPDPPVPAS